MYSIEAPYQKDSFIVSFGISVRDKYLIFIKSFLIQSEEVYALQWMSNKNGEKFYNNF